MSKKKKINHCIDCEEILKNKRKDAKRCTRCLRNLRKKRATFRVNDIRDEDRYIKKQNVKREVKKEFLADIEQVLADSKRVESISDNYLKALPRATRFLAGDRSIEIERKKDDVKEFFIAINGEPEKDKEKLTLKDIIDRKVKYS